MGEEADTQAWDAAVKEYLVDTGKIAAGGVASIADGCRMFGAAIDNGDPWTQLVKSGYQIDVLQEDGSTTTCDCDEAETMRQAIVDGRAPNGVYIGGVCYKLADVKREFTYNDQNYDIAILGKQKGGGFLIKTPNDSVAIALYDEEKGQNKVEALNTTLAFAEYLFQGGY
ncbi:profilin [Cyclospora cayetanensis]|uniref:Profilin n=2 Tax=Cyclospora cayetanensis TaxID=88456 RepID=A0A1D3D3Q5_9EIME|nr:profilin [Cyclospora cayetanensis]OEH78075.1 19 kda sporozoite antigen [Cyclospora cayetanensis]